MAVTAALVVTAGCTAEAPSRAGAMSPKARNYLTEALDIMERNSLLSAEVDWTAVRREAFDRAGTARTPAETYGAVRQALRDLEDQHSQFMDPDQTRPPEGRMLAHDIGYLALPPVPSDEAADDYVRQRSRGRDDRIPGTPRHTQLRGSHLGRSHRQRVHVYDGPVTPDREIHDDARDLSSHGDQVLMAATRWLSSRPDCRQ
ncbi:hypothetical protein ACFVW5_22835 [Streptomyces sp. NPDC058232]|uniref:hypothetical protein n=1 Tax=Streptomyces sp. NPDC058232 TaxID=3346393 RepID=UPI0036EADE03